MTRAHLEEVVSERDRAALMVEYHRNNSDSRLSRDMAAMLETKAARLAEVAAHIATQIEGTDDADA
jgi:hypothetical protein